MKYGTIWSKDPLPLSDGPCISQTTKTKDFIYIYDPGYTRVSEEIIIVNDYKR